MTDGQNGKLTLDGSAGTSGDLSIEGGLGADDLTGGEGNDTFVVEANELVSGESIDGGAGDDIISFTGNNSLNGATLADLEVIDFNGTDVDIDGLTSVLDGETYEVTDTDGSDHEFILDPNGDSSLNFSGITAGNTDAEDDVVEVDFSGNANTNLANEYVGSGLADSVTGGDQADTIGGGVGDDTIDGGAGDDQLTGGAGADNITGGAGADDLDGSAGEDTFLFEGDGSDGEDTINNFTQADDEVDFVTAAVAGADGTATDLQAADLSGGGDVATSDGLIVVDSGIAAGDNVTLNAAGIADAIDGTASVDALTLNDGDEAFYVAVDNGVDTAIALVDDANGNGDNTIDDGEISIIGILDGVADASQLDATNFADFA
jgi:Ca2+-binding RTX toxin-like protein